MTVVFHHLFVLNQEWFSQTFGGWPRLLSVFSWISGQNHQAVMFFFVLSGFVIYLSTSRLDFRKREDLNFYLYKRFRRILPLYWLTLVLTALFGIFFFNWNHPSFSFPTFLGNAFFLQTVGKVKPYWFQPYGLNGPLWSLAYEMFYYLFYPLFIVALLWLREKMKGRFFTAGIHTFGLWLAVFISISAIGMRQIAFTPFFAFLNLFAVWFAGCWLGYLYKNRERADGHFLAITLLFLTLWLLSGKIGSDTLRALGGAWLMVSLGYGYYRFGARLSAFMAWPKKALNLLFFHAGEGSYAIYLLHYPLLLGLAKWGALPLWLVLLILGIWLTMLVWLENRLSRRPFSFLKRRYV